MASWVTSSSPWRLGWYEDVDARQQASGVIALCSTAGCVHDASVYDRETGDGRCFDCAELLIERQLAAALNRDFAQLLPRLDER